LSDFHKAFSCESIAVDLHSDLLVVTLCGAMSPAERDYDRDRQAGEALEKSYRQRGSANGRQETVLGA
jgi:hypothetical protein